MVGPSDLRPLDRTEVARIVETETEAERFWKRIPLVGGWIADSIWMERNRPIWERVGEQLASRPENTIEAWPEDRRELAAKVCGVIQREMGWPADRFVPWDPCEVVFWAYQDGLDHVVALGEFEATLGVPISEDEYERYWIGTLGEVVEKLHQKLKRSTSTMGEAGRP